MSVLLLAFTPFILRAESHVTRDPGDFVALAVAGKIRIELYHSGRNSLEIETTGTTPDNVLIENDDQKLTIRLKTNTPKEARIKVKVYYTSLQELDVQARGLITSPEILKGEEMDFEAKSGGKMELDLYLNKLSAEVSQGAILVFSGKVEKQTIAVNTGGTYSSFPLEARDTYVKAATGGKAKVTARRVIDANANIKGYIGYQGEPVSKLEKTSLGGEIVHVKP